MIFCIFLLFAKLFIINTTLFFLRFKTKIKTYRYCKDLYRTLQPKYVYILQYFVLCDGNSVILLFCFDGAMINCYKGIKCMTCDHGHSTIAVPIIIALWGKFSYGPDTVYWPIWLMIYIFLTKILYQSGCWQYNCRHRECGNRAYVKKIRRQLYVSGLRNTSILYKDNAL